MDQLNYETAFAELQQIEAEIMDETITVDELAEKVKRASVLIAFCRTRLRATEDEVNAIVKGWAE